MKHEVHLPQGTIRYREDGNGEPLLFVHGVLVNGDLWRKVVPQLSKDFRCIVPDWPFGSHETPLSPDADLSPPALAQMIVDFMDAIGLESATLVGNDTGGALCQLVATEHPERVSRLVLTSCDIYDRFPPPPFKPLGPITKMPGLGLADHAVASGRGSRSACRSRSAGSRSACPKRPSSTSGSGRCARRAACGATSGRSSARSTRATRSRPRRS